MLKDTNVKKEDIDEVGFWPDLLFFFCTQHFVRSFLLAVQRVSLRFSSCSKITLDKSPPREPTS